MFENSLTARPAKLQNGASSPHCQSGVAVPAGALPDGSAGHKTGGSQHLKNALNLGKVVGAKVNDLLRRRDTGNLGVVGVTEVNRSAEAVWSCIESGAQGIVGNSHVTMDSFPRLDPPPPTSKKRLPRALTTTRDMMISSSPVVATPNITESSYMASPDKMALIQRPGSIEPLEKEGEEVEKEPVLTFAMECKLSEEDGRPYKEDTLSLEGTGEGKVEEEEEEDLSQLLLSVPDLIYKDILDPKQIPGGPESWGGSLPHPEKAGFCISMSDHEFLGNGSLESASADNEGLHPDLLSFE
ncbi:uncharacterized protein C1orf226 homolog [Conger conger]|uniref:uncharacterized protein C1orf226 homolog n=1 Tax=Conger conger TaxID=82655 RepID=UPI002A5AC2F6|nr:uncharacterized protein C1orf226 homolog [Conger conger]